MASFRKLQWKNGPNDKQQAILDAAFEYVNSVPYKVSLRWVFYRLYQDGFYNDKKGYKCFEILCSRARHTRLDGWKPSTLADETREAIKRVFGVANEEEAAEVILYNLEDAARVSLDHFYQQDYYVELWFEARAMAGQFKHYTERINLAPMGGNASIPFKWDLAKRLEAAAQDYEKNIVILYFGDEDLAGHAIEKDITEDVKKWCGAPLKVIRCGLTKAQAKKYSVPESYEKKGFQWEALADDDAAEIILFAMTKYVNFDVIEECKKEEQRIEKEWTTKIRRMIRDL